MSEYQHYEFRTINRQLTAAERTAVDKLSSHGHTTATSFSVEYNWGDFKHDSDEVLAKYFDMFFYIANWGSVELKFCFPKELIDLYALEPYCVEEEGMTIDTKTVGDRVIVSFAMHEEGGWGWLEGDGMIDGVVALYDQILHGDKRIFYLAWLGAAEFCYEYSDLLTEDTLEPPVPPHLDKVTPALTAFVELFGINSNLINAAAQGTQQGQTGTTVDLHQALASLAKEECIDFLQRFLDGEAHLDLKLKQRLGLFQTETTYNPSGTRTVGDLLALRDTIQVQQAEAAAAAKEVQHRAEMAALAARGDTVWREVEVLFAEKKTSAYQQAAKLLEKLGQLADEQGKSDNFERRIESIRAKYSRRSALIQALRHL